MSRIFAKQSLLRAGATAMMMLAIFAAPGTVQAQTAAQAQQAIDSDLVKPTPVPSHIPNAPAMPTAPTAPYPQPYATPSVPADPTANPRYMYQPGQTAAGQQAITGNGCAPTRSADGTYQKDDLIGAATGVFGTGAHGLADIIESILRKQGRPVGYITGREAGGAFAVGLRYGSGTLCSRADGALPVYWTGPSIGFDAGASAAKTFVLVYNLDHNEDIFKRFAAGEGQAYIVGGLNVSYLRHGHVVLIPVRMGVGMRLGVNGGYMKISRKQNWFPF